MSAQKINDVKKRQLEAVGASETNKEISNIIEISIGERLNFRLDTVCSGVVVGGGITVQLQQRTSGGQFVNLASSNSSVSITANGTASILLNKETVADLVDLPLMKSCRLLVTTGAGSAVTFDKVTTYS